MHLVTLISFACTVISASAFQFPEFVPLHRRQEAGTPAYECHANCGGVIVDARTDGYCDSEDFTIELADCLACALEYDIWQYYGTSVSEAAEACGLTATPAEASSTTTSDSASATETAEQSATSVVDSSIITDTASSATRTTIISTSVPSSNGVHISSRPFSSIPSATAARSSAASTPSSSTLYSGASSTTYGRSLLDVLAGFLVANFM
ncbi:hypothetical protein N7533_011694 [Penicillium manginii]|uniref:uncharacterized protein n=1 Tax=Penicillium manginii TaxID=203109 RepID=UPI002547D06E|nr:uncharacterized protein N7533_011694 [Penicillium manginii]KAJ5742285.1 hypothetical protein N7533_011694 [Penicillium manginii]